MSAPGGRTKADLQRPEDVEVDDRETDRSSPDEEEQGGHSGHSRWLMIACCIPMLAIAILLVAAGAGAGFLIIALACTAMMAAMMAGISGAGSRTGDRR